MILRIVSLGTVNCTIWDVGRDWKSKGAQADGRTIYLLAFRKVWFVSGWLFTAGVYSDCLLNIQSIFSTLGYVPHVSETTAVDYHLLHYLWNNSRSSLLLSVLETVCHFLSLVGPCVFTREKAILHNCFQSLSCWLSELHFLALKEGSV